MKAMVLAAGRGTRLRPLTDNCPKCLIPLAGRPLIEWTLWWLRSCGVTSCIINLHYLPDMVRDFVGDGSRYGLNVHYSYEEELLGTAGAVKKVADFFSDGHFYVIYSDNFSQWDLRKLRRGDETISPKARNDVKIGDSLFFRHGKMEQSPFFIAVHWSDDVTQSGMIEIADNDQILHIIEKPKAKEVTSHYVNAGFYFLHPHVFDYIPDGEFCDFGYHVFPRMLQAGEQLYAVRMDEPIIGIDTLVAYDKANTYAVELIERTGFPLPA